MSKVFAQVTPSFKGKIVSLEVDVNTKENYPLLDQFKIMTIPTSVLVTSKGQVLEKFSGVVSPTDMTKKLDHLLSTNP